RLSLRSGKSGGLLAAAEGLEVELGQLLGPDAEVLLDRQTQHGGQPLRLVQGVRELLRDLLLLCRQGPLTVRELQSPGHPRIELSEADVEVRQGLAVGHQGIAEPLQAAQPSLLRFLTSHARSPGALRWSAGIDAQLRLVCEHIDARSASPQMGRTALLGLSLSNHER